MAGQRRLRDGSHSDGDSAASHESGYETLLLHNQLCHALYAASSGVIALYRELLTPLGVTYSQYLVLMALWERSPSFVGDVGRALGLDSATLTPLTKRMEQAGWITRRRDPTDERRVKIDLTPAGWALRDSAVEVRREVVRRLPMTAQQLVELRTALQALNRGLGQLEPEACAPGGATRGA